MSTVWFTAFSLRTADASARQCRALLEGRHSFFANLFSSVVLRAVVGLSGSACFHCRGPNVVSGDLERMSQ